MTSTTPTTPHGTAPEADDLMAPEEVKRFVLEVIKSYDGISREDLETAYDAMREEKLSYVLWTEAVSAG